MRPTHLPPSELIESWPAFSADAPLIVLVSGCLAGEACGVDGTSYGGYPLAKRLLDLENVRAVKYCPENAAFGTPRKTPNIYGGDGFDVLDGRAKIMTDDGDDWTNGLVETAQRMRELAIAHSARLALLMDISAACGSSVIYDGPRHLRVYRRGPGVAAATLLRAGIPIVSQRDERTLSRILTRLGAPHRPLLTDAADHYERSWYREYFALA